MKNFDGWSSSNRGDDQRDLLGDFCRAHQGQTPQEQAMLDQAASEFRDTLRTMGLSIETEEQFRVACMVSVLTAVNFRQLVDSGVPTRVAEDVAMKTIAALRPYANE